jgi:hypothetical protein
MRKTVHENLPETSVHVVNDGPEPEVFRPRIKKMGEVLPVWSDFVISTEVAQISELLLSRKKSWFNLDINFHSLIWSPCSDPT